MSARADGGPAFPTLERCESWKHREPHEEPEIYYAQEGGMSLRDWFAGQALNSPIIAIRIKEGVISSMSDLAEAAFFQADAMLAARKVSP